MFGRRRASLELATASTLQTNVPIGRAIPNTRLYVLDSHSQPVPIGVAGELCVGGVGVGRGYLNDPERMKQRFSRDPFSSHRGARLYRSGDLARRRADGVLESFPAALTTRLSCAAIGSNQRRLSTLSSSTPAFGLRSC